MANIDLVDGIPVFLAQLSDALRMTTSSESVDYVELRISAGRHGHDLFHMGLTVDQVVHDYGDVCRAITEHALQNRVAISGEEFRIVSLCLDEAIAAAVREWTRLRDSATNGRSTHHLGLLAHELRNFLNTGMLAYDTLKRGQAPIGGSTGQLLGRSLTNLRALVDRSLTDVRLEAGIHELEHILVADLLADIEIGAALQADARGLHFKASSVEPTLAIEGDWQTLVGALSNLLQNAFKFTRKGSTVSLTTTVTPLRVLFEVQDECGGLPTGKVEELFAPYSQRGRDRTGLGLGLPICLKAAKANRGEISVRDEPGSGCVFILNLPRKLSPPSSVVDGGATSDGPPIVIGSPGTTKVRSSGEWPAPLLAGGLGSS